jgi:hypothetical protein
MTVPGPFTMSQQAQNDHYPDLESAAMGYAAAVNEVRDPSTRSRSRPRSPGSTSACSPTSPTRRSSWGVLDLSVADRVRRAFPYLPPAQLVVAPDCGMKYLPWASAEGKMRDGRRRGAAARGTGHGAGLTLEEDQMQLVTEDNITELAEQRWGTAHDPRLAEILRALVRHLHRFAREVRLTEAEWMAAIRGLTRTGQASNDKRKEFILPRTSSACRCWSCR